jgi:hypothetical protein
VYYHLNHISEFYVGRALYHNLKVSVTYLGNHSYIENMIAVFKGMTAIVGLFLINSGYGLSKQFDINDTFDFGFGGARYKSDYGNKHWHEASLYIFAPRFRAVCVNLLYSAVGGLSLGLNYLTDRAGFTRRLKRRWRNLLQSRKE